MVEQDEVTDSTDWLPTPLNPLAQLESSLRCQVCKEFFTTPMMTSCSHTFCSLCIRRYLSQEGKCPACRENDQEIKLRRNWVVEELVTNFKASRSGLLEFAQNAASLKKDENVETERPNKRRKVEQLSTNGAERRSTRSQSKNSVMPSGQQGDISTPEVILDSEDDGSTYEDAGPNSPRPLQPTKEPNDGRVACPCCHRRMKETLINSHLDKCIAGDSSTPQEEISSPARQLAPPGSIAYGLPKPLSERPTRLPFINYSLLNDNALRKKLRDLGIPNGGTKEHMRRRHTEWVNLWNANCDSTNPATKRQILQQLKIWEDALGRPVDRMQGASGFMSKEFDREGHVKTQKDSFNDLIQQARQKRLAPKQPEIQSGAGSGHGQSPSDAERGDLTHLEGTSQPNLDGTGPLEPIQPPNDFATQPGIPVAPEDVASSVMPSYPYQPSINELPHNLLQPTHPPAGTSSRPPQGPGNIDLMTAEMASFPQDPRQPIEAPPPTFNPPWDPSLDPVYAATQWELKREDPYWNCS